MHKWSAIARRIRVPLGFAFAIFYLWLAKPTWKFMALGGVLCVPGLLLRALASGHVQKNSQLTTSGPYAYMRNPLYLGSFIMAASFALAARNLWIALAILLIFIGIYLPVVLAEEEFLRSRFPEFRDYEQRVPRLLPRHFGSGNPKGNFSVQLYWQHREYNSFLGACAMMAALAAKILWCR